MDPYREPVQRVDDALGRLKTTLAAYNTKEVPHSDRNISNWARVPSGALRPKDPQLTGDARGQTPDEMPWENPEPLFLDGDFDLTTTEIYPDITNVDLRVALNNLHLLCGFVHDHPYNMTLHLEIARAYLDLGYPDLAVGTAYKALLLNDATQDESDELHEEAVAALKESIAHEPMSSRASMLGYDPDQIKASYRKLGRPDMTVRDKEVEVWARQHYGWAVLLALAQALYMCGCLKSAHRYCRMGLTRYAKLPHFSTLAEMIKHSAAKHFSMTPEELLQSEYKDPLTWPDMGYVRRERYPWNDHEPNRLNDVDFLNEQLGQVAPKLEVRAVELPLLTFDENNWDGSMIKQLGVFAKDDIAPGEVLLDETSLLTANNKLQDALCDACSEDLPHLNSPKANAVVPCTDCPAVFCSQKCYDLAMESYHPALCDMDVEAIAKDVPPAEAADSLYSLLLLRCFAMAETQECHPLDLSQVKYIWGDYHTKSLNDNFEPHKGGFASDDFPKELPFSFEKSVVLPYHMLEKMDVNFFEKPQYDVWVFNTLFAKFRGTASARLSGLGGRAIRGPEVSAVHPMWCLANHSCDPNVQWEWGGSISFWARKERVKWQGRAGQRRGSEPGIRKGEEVLNHYCDVDLPVQERRAWARGSLGGDCCCDRCVWEAEEERLGGTKA